MTNTDLHPMTGTPREHPAPGRGRRFVHGAPPGPLWWLRVALVADVALLGLLTLLAGGRMRSALLDPEPWLVVTVAVALVPVVAFLVAAWSSRAATFAAAIAAVSLLSLAALVPAADVVLAVLWWLLHLAAQPVLLARSRAVAGSVFEQRLRVTGAAMAALSLAPAAARVSGSVADALAFVLIAAGWMAWNGSARPSAARGGTSGALLTVDRALQRQDGDGVDAEAVLDVVRHQLGAESVTLVDEGRVVASTASEDRRWRLLALAALDDATPLRPTGDGTRLHVADTGRGELLVEFGTVSELLGEAELEVAAWIAQRIGLAMARHETRRRDRQAMASLRAADRMRDDFLATLSHELRTPLTSIRGFSEVLHDNAATLDARQMQDLLRRVVTNASQLEVMIAGLLDLTMVRGRSHPERIADYDLADLVERAVARVSGPLRDHHVEIDVPGVQLTTDGGAVLSILEAILDNCAKFTPPGTLVRVAGKVDGQHAELEVLDDGPGLPADLQERVLDPFVRGGDVLTRETRGVGIGLAIAAELARQLEGELLVDRPRTGTKLRLLLPRAHSMGGALAPASSALTAPGRVRADLGDRQLKG